MKSLFDFVYECCDDIEFANEKAKELEKIVNEMVEERAQYLAEKKFNDMKEKFHNETVREINEGNVRKKGEELSRSSPYISENIVVGDRKLCGCDFISTTLCQDSQYEDDKLILNDSQQEWQLLYKNGRRKYVSNFIVTGCLIVNAKAPGICKAFVVFLHKTENPLIFYDGKIESSEIINQTFFNKRGINTNKSAYCESFIRALKMCTNISFLTIPEHSGWNLLPNGKYDYTSSLSVNSNLEELYPEEIKQHKLINSNRDFKDVLNDYKKILEGTSWKTKLVVSIRIMSLFLLFYQQMRLKSDRVFVLIPDSDYDKNILISLIKRINYSSNVITSLSDRITKVQKALLTGNDMTVLFSYFEEINDLRAFKNSLKEIRMDITGENNVEDSTRKIILIFTDVPVNIPYEYPAYYLQFTEEIKNIDVDAIQKLSGEFDFLLIQYIINNMDYVKQSVHKAIDNANKLLNNNNDGETMKMLITTVILLKEIGFVSETEFQKILDWTKNEATSRQTMNEAICCEFKSALSESICNDEIKIARQSESPYYTNDGKTAFIADKDKSINFEATVLEKIIFPKIKSTSHKKMLNTALEVEGLLIKSHSQKRKFKVNFGSEVYENVEVFSYSRTALSKEAKQKVDDIIENEFWFRENEIPENFVPTLINENEKTVAGYIFSPDDDINRHEYIFGSTRSGKTFSLVQKSLQRAYSGEIVIIFDQTGAFTQNELIKHISSDILDEYFSFWRIYEDGFPVDMLDFRDCITKKDKKEKIARIYAVASKSIGRYEEKILKNVAKRMLDNMEKGEEISLTSVIDYIAEDNTQDDSHEKLIYKLRTILDNFPKTFFPKNNWKEFIEQSGKKIIVISTGTDGVCKGSEIIDMLLENLYCFKQCYSKQKYTVVIDEVQDLYLIENGSLNTLLRKGGKYNISMLLASQSFPDSNISLGKIVGNCGRICGYRPKFDELKRVADFFNCDRNECNSLNQGFLIENGLFFSRYADRNINKTLKGKTIKFPLILKDENKKSSREATQTKQNYFGILPDSEGHNQNKGSGFVGNKFKRRQKLH